MKRTSRIAGLVLLGALAAQAAPVDASYTVSGSAGNWLLNFSVTNNLGGTNGIYYFGLKLPTHDIAGDPSGWAQPANPTINWSVYGGASIEYNDLWITSPTGSFFINPGFTLSGFEAVDTDVTLPSGVNWFAVAAGGLYPSGLGCSFICGPPYDNPGFQGVATSVAAPVPEPASRTLLATIAAIALWIRRRGRGAQPEGVV